MYAYFNNISAALKEKKYKIGKKKKRNMFKIII